MPALPPVSGHRLSDLALVQHTEDAMSAAARDLERAADGLQLAGRLVEPTVSLRGFSWRARIGAPGQLAELLHQSALSAASAAGRADGVASSAIRDAYAAVGHAPVHQSLSELRARGSVLADEVAALEAHARVLALEHPNGVSRTITGDVAYGHRKASWAWTDVRSDAALKVRSTYSGASVSSEAADAIRHLAGSPEVKPVFLPFRSMMQAPAWWFSLPSARAKFQMGTSGIDAARDEATSLARELRSAGSGAQRARIDREAASISARSLGDDAATVAARERETAAARELRAARMAAREEFQVVLPPD